MAVRAGSSRGSDQQVGSVDGVTCRWNVCFSSLKEWVSVMVLAEQAGGDSAVVAGIGIP